MSIVTLGLDLSLASTGLALAVDGDLKAYENVVTKGKKGDTHREHMPRIMHVSERINDWLAEMHAIHGEFALATIEAPSYNSRFGNPHERAGLWWKVYEHLWSSQVTLEAISPATRAKYIAGKGNAKKPEVLEQARLKWGEVIPNHDVADAVGMAMWGWEEVVSG